MCKFSFCVEYFVFMFVCAHVKVVFVGYFSSSADGLCELTHEGWNRVQVSPSSYGPRGDHTNGTGWRDLSGLNHCVII